MTESNNPPYAQLVEDFGTQLQEAIRRNPPSRRDPRIAGVGALAVAGIAAGALVLVGAGSNGHVDGIAQARAALAPVGRVVHLVTTSHLEIPGARQGTTAGGQGELSPPQVVERWSASDPTRWRVATVAPVATAHGSVRGQIQRSYDNGTEELYVQPLNTLEITTGVTEGLRTSDGALGVDPVARISKMLDGGELHDAGSGIVDGQRVERLVGEEPGSPPAAGRARRAPWPVEYDVEPGTYAPVRLTLEEVGVTMEGTTGAATEVIDVNSYEQQPLDPTTAQLLSIHPTGQPIVSHHGG